MVHLAGRPAVFEMTAKALKKAVKPALDDEFASKVGVPGGIEDLRNQMKEIIQSQYDQASRLKVKRQLLDALAERADFPVPQGLVDAEFEGIWQRVEADKKAGRLMKRVQDLFPRLTTVPSFAWAGTFAETKDGLPFFGPHPQWGPRVLFAMAYGGNGITYSAIGAEIIAAAIERRRHPLAELFGFARLKR